MKKRCSWLEDMKEEYKYVISISIITGIIGIV